MALPNTGTGKGCQDELNMQLQMIDARLKQAENNISTLGKGLAEVAAGVPTPSFGPIGQAFKAMAAMQGTAFANAFQAVIDSIPTDIKDAMTGLLIQAALTQLGTATILAADIAAATQRLEDQYNSIMDELAVWMAVQPPTPESIAQIARLNELLSTVQSASDAAVSAFTAVSNISQCKSKALLIS